MSLTKLVSIVQFPLTARLSKRLFILTGASLWFYCLVFAIIISVNNIFKLKV